MPALAGEVNYRVSRAMNWLRNASISVKLNVLSSFTVAGALLVCGVVMTAAQIYFLLEVKRNQLVTLADVVGSNCSAAIEFDDPATASRLLQSLQQQPTVLEADLLNGEGRILAAYRRTDRQQAAGRPAAGSPSGGAMVIEREIRRGGETLGSIRIRAGFADVWQHFGQFAAFGLATFAATLGLTVAAGRWVQRQLREPILELAAAARRVTREHDLSVRVSPKSTDELGLLCEGFNAMLGQLEDNRDALEKVNEELEGRVRLRTGELQRALEQAEAASAAKTNFLANMSHEIRTPMTAILGYLDFLEDDSTPLEQRRQYAETVRRNGKHLLGIINDILDLSKIEAGHMQLENVSCSLRQIAYEVASLMGVRAKEKGLELRFQVRGRVPERIETDPLRLKQILVNLVGNAVKFTERGFVELLVEMAPPDRTGLRHARFTVRDTGLGMTSDVLEKIFDPFTQADESMSRRFGGTGLGLSISRRLATLLHGNICAKSVPGIGSEFIVEIDPGPLTEVAWIDDQTDFRTDRESKTISSPAPSLPEGLSILLAEDSPDNQLLVSTLLRRGGATVTLAGNGQIAVELAQQRLAEGRPYDIILMDMQMPIMDGYEATRTLRASQYPGKIVALTAHAMSSDRERCLAAGCDDFSTKPIDRPSLFAAIRRQVTVDSNDSSEADASNAVTAASG